MEAAMYDEEKEIEAMKRRLLLKLTESQEKMVNNFDKFNTGLEEINAMLRKQLGLPQRKGFSKKNLGLSHGVRGEGFQGNPGKFQRYPTYAQKIESSTQSHTHSVSDSLNFAPTEFYEAEMTEATQSHKLLTEGSNFAAIVDSVSVVTNQLEETTSEISKESTPPPPPLNHLTLDPTPEATATATEGDLFGGIDNTVDLKHNVFEPQVLHDHAFSAADPVADPVPEVVGELMAVVPLTIPVLARSSRHESVRVAWATTVPPPLMLFLKPLPNSVSSAEIEGSARRLLFRHPSSVIKLPPRFFPPPKPPDRVVELVSPRNFRRAAIEENSLKTTPREFTTCSAAINYLSCFENVGHVVSTCVDNTDVNSYTMLLNVSTRLMIVAYTHQVFDQMFDQMLKCNLEAWNATITGCKFNRHEDVVCELFKDLQQLEVESGKCIFSSMLILCSLGLLNHGRHAHFLVNSLITVSSAENNVTKTLNPGISGVVLKNHDSAFVSNSCLCQLDDLSNVRPLVVIAADFRNDCYTLGVVCKPVYLLRATSLCRNIGSNNVRLNFALVSGTPVATSSVNLRTKAANSRNRTVWSLPNYLELQCLAEEDVHEADIEIIEPNRVALISDLQKKVVHDFMMGLKILNWFTMSVISLSQWIKMAAEVKASVFIAVHEAIGKDGKLQSLWNAEGIPSTNALQLAHHCDDVYCVKLFSIDYAGAEEWVAVIVVFVIVYAIILVHQPFRPQLTLENAWDPLYTLLVVVPPELRHAMGALVDIIGAAAVFVNVCLLARLSLLGLQWVPRMFVCHRKMIDWGRVRVPLVLIK